MTRPTEHQIRRAIRAAAKAFPNDESGIIDTTKRLEFINEILGGYGVEPLRGVWWCRSCGNCHAEYVNFGDPYDLTVVYDYHRCMFRVMSWGDYVEMFPKRFEEDAA